MTTCYLDAEDEITGAVARLRQVPDRQAILVLPAGSRIGTSRINFRLLEREATERAIDILVVSDEPGTRALAISAGLPAYDTVAAAEAALTQFERQDEQLARRTGRPPDPPGERTRVMPAVAAPAAADAAPPEGRTPPPTQVLGPPQSSAGSPAGSGRGRLRQQARPAAPAAPARPATDEFTAVAAGATSTRRRRRPRLLPSLALLLLLLLVAGAAYAGYLLLPTASIALRPHIETLGPLQMTVAADPGVAVPDAAEGIIPAQRLDVPLAVSDTFAATGSDVTQSRATGTVRFRSENTLFEVPIPTGTRVTTAAGVAFETTRAVTLERASFDTGPTTADAPVRAVRAGPRSNVDAGAITRVPQSLSAALVTVRNPQPTSGGSREEVAVVTAEDYETAYRALVARLPAELQRTLADPATTPRGLTLFPSSARTMDPRPEPPADDVVDTPTAEFELTVEAAATVLAVNEALVDEVVLERVAAQVPAGATVHDDGVAIERPPGSASATRVTYTITATAQTYRLPDREALLAQVRGRSISEAEAIMVQYGSVELSVWPEFIDRLPDQISRINLTILPPQESP